jgi:1-acyl-sn-glycerol-3-phosphate acyltransferase
VLRLLGWRVHFAGFPTKQGVVIVYPHTSNWDFIVMILAKWAIGIPARFWGKDTLFAIPLFGRWLRWLGGIPVDRQHPKGVVGAMVDQMRDHKAQDQLLWLGLSPEGTRKRTEGFRSGFYRLACDAQVPLAVIALDYRSKTVRVLDFLELTGVEDLDYTRLQDILAHAQGFHPQQAAPIRPLPVAGAQEDQQK